MQLVEMVRDLGQYGPAKPPAEHGLDEVNLVLGVQAGEILVHIS